MASRVERSKTYQIEPCEEISRKMKLSRTKMAPTPSVRPWKAITTKTMGG